MEVHAHSGLALAMVAVVGEHTAGSASGVGADRGFNLFGEGRRLDSVRAIPPLGGGILRRETLAGQPNEVFLEHLVADYGLKAGTGNDHRRGSVILKDDGGGNHRIPVGIPQRNATSSRKCTQATSKEVDFHVRTFPQNH